MADDLPPASSTPKPGATRARGAKPRAGIQRKTKEEREQYAKQEAERQASRNAEAAKNAAGRGGARARGGRAGLRGRGGRGGSTSDDSRGRDVPSGSGGGVFGATVRQQDVKPKTISEGVSEMLVSGQAGDRGDSGHGGTFDGGEGAASSGSGHRGGTTRQHFGDNIDVATDDEPEEFKRDIERIWISSDEDEDDLQTGRRKHKSVRKSPRPGAGLRPVRAPRSRREEEDQAITKHKKSNRIVKKSDSAVHDDDDDAMDLDDSAPAGTTKERTSSPEVRRRSIRRPSGKAREVKFANETIEERAERLRVTDDISKLGRIFSQHSQHPKTKIKQSGDDNENSTSESDEDFTSPRENLFLIQLPPLTPYLHDTAQYPDNPQVKEEPDDTNISAPAPTTTSSTKEPTSSTDNKPNLQTEGVLTATEPLRLPPGLVGKLRVHKSGKVSLDWGGTDMEVRYGTEVDFLQDVVLIEPPAPVTSQQHHKLDPDHPQHNIDNDKHVAITNGSSTDRAKQESITVKHENSQEPSTGHSTTQQPGAANTSASADDNHDDAALRRGTTYALGQVRTKLVLIPDWAKLYD